MSIGAPVVAFRMFKLVDFLQKKKKEGGKDSKKKSGSQVVVKPAPALQLNRREKQEIRATLRGFQGSEAHDILMKQLAEHDIVEEIVAEEVEDDSSYSSGTFCVRSIGDGEEEAEEEEEEEQNYGTFCVNSFSSSGAEEEVPKPSFLSQSTPTTRSPSTPKKSKKKGSGGGAAATSSAPDFSNMFREPEDWEKCILSLEKGEWTDQMESKGAFKRWKKERPAMPSAYLKSSPFASGDMFAAPGGK